MQAVIDELKRQIEDEKQNMGAAGKRREEELTSQIKGLESRVRDLEKTEADLRRQINEL